MNSDDVVDINDVTVLQQYLLGRKALITLQRTLADVDGDGKVSDNDVSIIQKYLAGKVSALPVKYGDVNGDKKINNADVEMIQKFVVGKVKLTGEQKERADVDLSGKVDINDATIIQSFMAKQTKKLPKLPANYKTK